MKIAIAQMNPVIGAIKSNAHRALEIAIKSASHSAQLVVFPELYLTGYPPKDLLFRPDFQEEIKLWAFWLARKTPIPVLMGAPYDLGASGLAYNTALWCFEAHVKAVAHKRLLPTYNIFDEKRYFSIPNTPACEAFVYKNKRFLVSICEDSWNTQPSLTPVNYECDPVDLGFLENAPIDYFINISASPYTASKPELREQIFTQIAKKYFVVTLVAGQVGGNDQLLFDGHSLIIDSQGEIISRAQACEEDLLFYDSSSRESPHVPIKYPQLLELTLKALVMGIKDYVKKCGGKGLILGLSGGIDSAVCACLAVMAVGKEKVRLFYLPSQFSSLNSQKDAEIIAHNLRIKLETIPIESSVQIIRESLADIFSEAAPKNRELGDQNIQARIRGILLMGISNAIDYFLMSTSNKSELAVGYGTLYGDMCGAFSPLGDVYKTEVWRIARLLNKEKELIPESVINKPPTAELKPDQLDTDSLPDYFVLDQILYNYIDLDLSAEVISNKTGINISLINQVITMHTASEYKRRQAPMALMVSSRVFGDARRMPIAKRL